MAQKTITSTEFQTRAGAYIEQAAKQPIIITKHHRPLRVLIDIEEYERLKRYDTRQAAYPHELSDDLKAELDRGYKGKVIPKLDHLLD